MVLVYWDFIYHSDPKHKDRLYINIEYIWYLYIEYTTLTGNITTFCTLILNIYMVRILWVTPYHSSPKYKDLLYINIEYIWYLNLSHSIYHSDPQYKSILYIYIEYIWYLYIESLHIQLWSEIQGHFYNTIEYKRSLYFGTE